MKTNAEHQQNNADFSQLENEFLISDETGRMRTSNDTSKQIADEGRDFKTGGNGAENEG
ncbi:hypothetical protein D9M71_841370 [compost metagenome]